MKNIISSLLAALLLLSACSKQSLLSDDTLQRQAEQAGKKTAGITSYLTGDGADVTSNTTAGLLLMGGSTDVDNALGWMISKSGGGDAVVIRSTGADGYNSYLYTELGGLNSVETLIIDSRDKAADAGVLKTVRNAELLFIAGGDQWDYVNYWKDTPLEDAINYLMNTKGVPVGGTSAGLAILGNTYFSAQAGTVTSDKALKDPYNKYMIMGTGDFLNTPYLSNTITDSHYSQRERQGRHIAFLARMMQDWGMAEVKGIGVDEQTAVCVEANGIATVYGINSAWFLRNTGGGPETCAPRQPLTWNRDQQAIEAYVIPGGTTGQGRIDLSNWSQRSGGSSRYYYVNNGILY